MVCAWDALLGVIPQWLRGKVNCEERDSLLEIRLRINAFPELVFEDGFQWYEREIHQEDLLFCINTASKYSPWSATTIAQGYLTAPGGHRIGICGEGVCRDGNMSGIREVESLCIRVAKDFPGIAGNISTGKNTIILGAPGWGKTTVLRDLIRQKAEKKTVAVADERRELFPTGFQRGRRMDVLTGVPKPQAIERLLRTMGPNYIAMDEVTAEEDCKALYYAASCGVYLLASAHASSLEDFYNRPVYKMLYRMQLFDTVVILRPDRTFRTERMDK